MSSTTIPLDFRLGFISGLAATAANSGISPLEQVKFRLDFRHSENINYDLRIPRPDKIPSIVKQNLPKCAAKNLPFFTVYPFVNHQLEHHLSTVSANITSASISGFAQNAFFNSELKPSLSKGISGSIGWGSFFGISSALSTNNDSPLKTITIGAVAGAASALLPKISLANTFRGSIWGASTFSAMTLANRYFEKQN